MHIFLLAYVLLAPCRTFADHSDLNLHLSDEDERKIDAALSNGGFVDLVTLVLDKANEWKDVPVNIAVTGNSGSGKSTFINSFRGLTGDDEGATSSDVVESTMDPTPYPHPKNPMIKIWDLPGIGTLKFNKDNYVEKVNLKFYDFFLILNTERFHENDAWLAKEITSQGKRFYFVRNKVGIDVEGHKKSHPKSHDQQAVLAKIRLDCKTKLESFGIESPDIFLVDSLETQSYEFKLLMQFMMDDFPHIKQESFLLSIKNLGFELIYRKVAQIQTRIIYASYLSAGVAAIPVHGLSAVVDVGIAAEEFHHIFTQFGMDDDSIHHVANLTGANVDELMTLRDQAIVATVAGDFSRLDENALTRFAGGFLSQLVKEYVRFKYVAPLSSPLAAGLSYTTTNYVLNFVLDDTATIAGRVLESCIKDVKYS